MITRPIAALYEQGKVHHVGRFPRLEEQMCTGFWAISHLSEKAALSGIVVPFMSSGPNGCSYGGYGI